MNETSQKTHNLILENRQSLSLGGVNDVLGFNEEAITLSSEAGDLLIRGEALHISKLSLETGEVNVDGKINALIYTNVKQSKSLFSKLFK